MATKPKKNARYDLNAADRRRNLLIQIGLTAIVVIFAVGLVVYIVMRPTRQPGAGETKSIRVTSSNLITKEGTSEPKAVLSLYEDFLCPRVRQLREAVRPDDQQAHRQRRGRRRLLHGLASSTGPGDGILVAGGERRLLRGRRRSNDAFRRFHAALYAQQPAEGVGPFPDNARLIEVARQAGAAGVCPTASTRAATSTWSRAWPRRRGVNSTPTIRINGEDYSAVDARRAGRQDQGDRRRRARAGRWWPPPPNPEPTPPPAP